MMTYTEKLERLISETIDNEINEIIESPSTLNTMYGYYSAWVQILEGIKKTSESKEETDAKMSDAAATISIDWQGVDADCVPLYLLRDYLEDFCRQHLLPEKDSAYYNAIDIALDCVDWCDIAQSMEQDFCDPDNC